MTGFEDSVAALTGLGHLRVWSLIVTVFGDMARREGEAISGPVLGRVLAPVGVRPEAIRVALHRLRRDGWILSEKTGQTSRHRLTARGLAESAAASTRIYAREGPDGEGWRLMAISPGADAARRDALAAACWIRLGGGAFLGPATAGGAGPDDLGIAGALPDLPEWVLARVETAELTAGYAALDAALARAQTALGGAPVLSDEERATLRTLIVHGWRRLALKSPALPDAAHGPGWRGPECRRRAHALLDVLGRPEISTPGG